MKSKSMKQSLSRLSIIVIISFFILVLCINVGLQLKMEHDSRKESTVEVFGQLTQLIEANENNTRIVKRQFMQRCQRGVNIVAYYIESNPDIINSSEDMKTMMEMYNIEVVNFFDEQGKIYASSKPSNIGLTIEEAPKFAAFKPLLKDKSLTIYDEGTYNPELDEQKHYAAKWLDSINSIIHIGLKSEILTEQMEQTDIKQVIADLPFKLTGNIHVIDKEKLEVVASTVDDVAGKKVSLAKLESYMDDKDIVLRHVTLVGERHCIYSQTYNNYLFIRSYHSEDIFGDIMKSSLLIMFYYVLGSIGIIFTIRWYLKHYFTDNLNKIITEVKKIEHGDMEKIELHTGISEFDELLSYINHMLDSIRLNWEKLSYIMDKGGMTIGIIEKDLFFKKTVINHRILEILEIDNELAAGTDNIAIVENCLNQVLANVVDREENVYKFVHDSVEKYLRIEIMEDEQSIVYYVTDLTSWWNEINIIKEQSIIDDLTKLYNRRGFNEKMNSYFETIKADEWGAIVIVDTDGLKVINDCLGHHAGDEYLVNISQLLKGIVKDNAICARLGGDEFIIFLYGYDSLEDLEKMIESLKLGRNMAYKSQYDGKTRHMEYSLGVAMMPTDSKDFHFLMRMADERMYQDKRNRKKMR